MVLILRKAVNVARYVLKSLTVNPEPVEIDLKYALILRSVVPKSSGSEAVSTTYGNYLREMFIIQYFADPDALLTDKIKR